MVGGDLVSTVTVGPGAVSAGPRTLQGRPLLIQNLDLRNTIYLDNDRGMATPTPIAPLGQLAVDGLESWFLSTLASGVTVQADVRAGGLMSVPSPAQIADQIQIAGIPPSVKNVQSYSMIGQGTGGGGTFHTFGAAGRIWAAHLSFSLNGDSANTAAAEAYATVDLAGKILCVIELTVAGANTSNQGDDDLTIPGMAAAVGDTLNLSVNGGAAVPNCGMRASCVVLASFP